MVRSELFKVNSSNQLLLHDVNLCKLAEEQGTPLFVTSEKILKDTAAQFAETVRRHYSHCSVFYSVKTNYTPRIVQTLSRNGVGAEVVSHFELHLASEMLGIPGDKVILNGPGKSVDELKLAIAREIKTINVDSYQEAEMLEKLASKPRDFGVRFRPAATKYRKFGIPAGSQEMASLLGRVKKNSRLRLKGVHFHSGPAMSERKGCHRNIQAAAKFVGKLLEDGFDIDYLDVGAGFEPRLCGRTPAHLKGLEEYAMIVGRTVSELAKHSRTPKLELIFEPGTALVENSTILLTRINEVKPRSDYKIGIVDAGLAILWEARSDVPPLHPEKDIAIVNHYTSTRKEKVMLGGPLCLHYDFYPQASLSPIRSGDIAAIFDVGAYAQSMSEQFIVPRPKTVFITESGEVETIQRAETFQDILCRYVTS